MDSSTPNSVTHTESDSEILHQFLFFTVYKDGHVTVFSPPMQIIPAADDPLTGVKIKDVQISSEVSARMFLPPSATTDGAGKLPILLYIHGGGFCMQSAFSTDYTNFLTKLVAAGNILAVSVDYGIFPDRPIPACYEDSWTALHWIAGESADPWLQNHGDLNRLFIGGDSAGGNICHTLAARAGTSGLPSDVKISGMMLIHPYFGEDDKMWMYMCPTNEGSRDRRMKPCVEDLERTGCERVLVLVGEKDVLREAGEGYVKELKRSGWKGKVELIENKGKDHCFHLMNPEDDEAHVIPDKMIDFIHHHGDHKL